ncbi:LOB domain-containing protein 20-like [Cucurbita maxima]|uniref:LOB domain-containing protein 20-like n=1 Tax=Cucurbita maxima TaxID=3661 RepID=A0A6J1IJP1_CUCMA|nr:LOB domain-containing protein 20-like [Cucurbita maxima]XP_022975179.1 LOB domain-containing protein 20-like [Cucurbita maxima]
MADADHQFPRRKDLGKRTSSTTNTDTSSATPTDIGATTAPCGACKFLRRKCVNGCIFAPHFASDQGVARFAAVHKVFGASNVSKLLLHIPLSRRNDAVVTISYEAQARLSDPVYGCVSTVLALQQQVASLQAELAAVQSQLISSRLAFASAIQNSQPPQVGVQLQPAYSNNSSISVSASTSAHNAINLSSFASNYDLPTETAPSPHHLEPLHLPRRSIEDEEDEENSQLPTIFADDLLRPR